MEWLKNWLDPKGAERRGQVRSLYTEVDQAIERLCSGPEALLNGKAYHVFLAIPYRAISLREVYPGFPPIDEMSVVLNGSKDEIGIALHWYRQPDVGLFRYTALIKYQRQKHQSNVESYRSIDFGDEILRLNILREVLEVAQLNKSSARAQIPLNELIPG